MMQKVKKQIGLIVVLILVLWCTEAFSGTPSFFLEPEEGRFVYTMCSPYDQAVSDRLLPPSVVGRKCQAVFVPALSSESAVYLIIDEYHPSRPPTIVSVKFEKFLWGEMQGVMSAEKNEDEILTVAEAQKRALPQPKNAVSRSEAPIDADVAIALENAWNALLMRTRYPEEIVSEEIVFGVDGEDIHFANFTKRYGYRTGKVWSPENGTPSFELVELARDLQKYPALPEKERKDAAEALRKKAEKLIDRLKGMK